MIIIREEAMKLKLKNKILLISALSAAVPAIVIIIILIITMNSTEKKLTEKSHHDAIHEIQRIAKDIYSTSKVSDELISKKLDNSLFYMRNTIRNRGGAKFSGPTIVWQAKNQFTKDITPISLPSLKVGNTNFSKTFSIETTVPIIDETTQYYDATFTIFQRMNEEGDMLRVATNVQTLDNKRAIGTYIPVNNIDGSRNEVINTVLNGNVFKGSAYVVNKWYQTQYEPLKDNNGNVIGMIYSGISLDETVPELRQMILNTEVGKTGYVYVLRGSGPKKGEYIISLNGKRDGEKILDAKGAEGNEFIKNIINTALEKGDGEVFLSEYFWKNKDDEKPRKKIASVVYFKKFDWVIGAGIYEEELFETANLVESQTSIVILYTSIALVVIVFLVLLVNRMIIIGNRIA